MVATIREYNFNGGNMSSENGKIEFEGEAYTFNKFRASRSGRSLKDTLRLVASKGATHIQNKSGYTNFIEDLGEEEGLILLP